MTPVESHGTVRSSFANTLALVMAGGCGTRLGPLTKLRAKPAIPIARDYHLIDFTLSNCVNSGLTSVGVLTQYLAGSVRPVIAAWAEMVRACEFHVLAGSERGAYVGTADAVWQNRDKIKSASPSEVLILAADHIYAMDYGMMIETHRRHKALVTGGAVEGPNSQILGLGLMTTTPDGHVAEFVEKPVRPFERTGRSDVALASMGIYIFDPEFLLDMLSRDAASAISKHDFGHDVIPAALTEGILAYRFHKRAHPLEPGYWRDVGTPDAYWRANMELACGCASLDLNDPDWPFYGSLAYLSRDKLAKQRRDNVALGCIGRDVTIVNSIVHPGVRIGPGSHVEESVLLPGVTIGANSFLRRAIVDNGVWLQHESIVGADPDVDRSHHYVTEQGITLITDVPSPDRSRVRKPVVGDGVMAHRRGAELPAA